MNDTENPLIMHSSLFDSTQCEEIKRIAGTWPLTKAMVYEQVSSDTVESDTRQGKVSLISSSSKQSHSVEWYNSKYHLMIMRQANEYLKVHGMDVDLHSASYQYTVYDTTHDRFNLHADASVTQTEYARITKLNHQVRKLSMSIELDDPNSYEGCKVYFETASKKLIRFETQAGNCVLFPSYVKHEVSPLTSGVRRSMVVWFHGPWWK